MQNGRVERWALGVERWTLKSRKVPSQRTGALPPWLTMAGIGAIMIATIVVYLPALRGAFVWDDELLITKNPLLQTWSGLGEIWAFGRTADYFPLTNTVFWIEWHLFGNAPTGYHVVNILLQIADSLLVWLVLNRLRVRGAWLAAMIFAVHPVHVSSVAWISELKNVLSMFWALISTLFFFRFIERRPNGSTIDHLASLAAFILALLAKTQVVFLPVVLVLLLWWRDRARNAGQGVALRSFDWTRALQTTWPFFASAIVLGLITVGFQNRGIGEEEIVLGSLPRRLVNAGMAVWWYVGKLVAPVRLMAIYPNWRFDAPKAVEWLPLLALVLVVAVLWWFRNSGTRGGLVAFTGFVVALGPVLGFVKMAYVRSGTLVADHLQYSADLFLIALLAAGIAWLWAHAQNLAKVAIGVGAAVLITAAGLYSSSRAAVYRDEESLWNDNLARNPDAWQAHNRLGQLYFDRGRYADAAPHFERAAALKPELADNHNQLGLVYARLGQFEQGIAEYREALRLKEANPATARGSGVATIRTNLANALTITANNMTGSDLVGPETQQEAKRRYEEAIVQYEKALELEPRHPAIHRNLGMLLVRVGRCREAVQHLRIVLEIVPNEPNARELLQTIERLTPDCSQ